MTQSVDVGVGAGHDRPHPFHLSVQQAGIRGIPSKKPPLLLGVAKQGGLFARSSNLPFFNEGKYQGSQDVAKQGGLFARNSPDYNKILILKIGSVRDQYDSISLLVLEQRKSVHLMQLR